MDAIRAVHAAPGVRRVRLGSLEPMTVTEDFAREASELPGLMRQFHLSLQSGSPGVLKRMHRRYTPEEYRAAVDTLRRYMPDCAVTTDVITGFPGETEAGFQQTLDFVRDIALARIHVFPYSQRKGTVADAMPDQVDEAVRRARTKKLIEVGNQLEQSFVQGLVGTCQQVLFEQAVGEGLSEGYTGQYVRVRAAARPGELCRVRIESAGGALAHGTVIEHEQEEDTDE
jgi:threonylcarbamoyladenosine tRNA methylthiotransferase MtaB